MPWKLKGDVSVGLNMVSVIFVQDVIILSITVTSSKVLAVFSLKASAGA